jgi:hypothetical protein
MYDVYMEIIPLRFITDEDVSLVGKDLVTLATIKRLGFPVPDGIVIFPPHIPFKTILKSYLEHDTERFEQSLDIIRSKVFNIPLPEKLEHELKEHHLKASQVWKDALQRWMAQIRSKVWREGVSEQLVEDLSPIPIFFTGAHKSWGEAFYEPDSRTIEIKVVQGELSGDEQEILKRYVERLKKKILDHYVLHWIIDEKGIYIIQISAFTHTIEEKKFEAEVSIRSFVPEHKKEERIQTKLKLFGDFSEGLVVDHDIDGIYLASERIETDDQKIMKLVESGILADDYVIFQLTNHKSFSDVSSTLRLIHQPELVQKEIRTFLFAKHNYGKTRLHGTKPLRQSLLHLQLGIPKITSVFELEEMKKLMQKCGVERRGNTKYWVELSVPENWVHIELYLKAGLDGIIVDLDELYGALIGVEGYRTHPFYTFSAEVVLSFLKTYIKKAGVPILFKSERILDDEVVRFVVEEGVFGLILNRIQLGGARQYISRFEKRHMLNKHREV